ncbi:MAG: AraC family transcriptional regulator [Lachnospiraceae bacterium]|nr:AraC family transcriptional regulator [Lachnospiraceae bacterium]
MNKHLLKIPCNAMPFICEADYSISLGTMIHADRIVPFHVAIYLLQGSMEIIEDGIAYQILPHQLFFLKSNVRHWGEKSFEPGSAWYYAHFYCEDPASQMKELPKGVYYDTKVCLDRKANEKYILLPKLTDCSGHKHIKKDFEKMIDAHVHGNIPQASVRLWQIFLECARSAQDDSVGSGYVQQIQEYIRTHYIEGFSSQEIEDVSGLSYKYAGTLFKEATGQTIKEYQCTLRLRKAEQLLKETNQPIAEIAQLTGFSDVFYFSKIFHREKGCSPSEYRRTYVPGI